MAEQPTPAQIAELYDRYAHVIYLRAYRILGDEAGAQDAVQETFARVIRNWGQFRGDSSPLTWMYRISTNWCLNQLRDRRGRERKHDANRQDILGEEAAYMASGEDAERLRGLLADADEETRRVVLHLFFDDMTREECAAIVGLSVPTVRKRLNQFLQRARRTLGVPLVAAAILAFFLIL